MTDQDDAGFPFAFHAAYTESTIIVYHHCDTHIANEAVQAQTLDIPTFNPGRYTWIKPSFRSALRQYRSAWSREQNLGHVIALHITREGWEEAIKWDHSRLSGETPYVRYRWDTELDLQGESLPFRFIQVDLTPPAVEKGLNKWIVEIKDVTDVLKEIGELVDAGRLKEATALLPQERPYEFLDKTLGYRSGA